MSNVTAVAWKWHDRLRNLSPEQRRHLANLLAREHPTRPRHGPNETILVAHLVSSANEKLTDSELREYLKSRLPEFMVPSRFVWHESFPVRPNGKIDRQQLPRGAPSGPESDPAPVESDGVHEKVCQIWREVLGVETVSAEDNFFELGGHSLLAIQVISRIRDAFGIELRLRAFFDQPTPTALSSTIRLSLQSCKFKNDS